MSSLCSVMASPSQSVGSGTTSMPALSGKAILQSGDWKSSLKIIFPILVSSFRLLFGGHSFFGGVVVLLLVSLVVALVSLVALVVALSALISLVLLF